MPCEEFSNGGFAVYEMRTGPGSAESSLKKAREIRLQKIREGRSSWRRRCAERFRAPECGSGVRALLVCKLYETAEAA